MTSRIHLYFYDKQRDLAIGDGEVVWRRLESGQWVDGALKERK